MPIPFPTLLFFLLLLNPNVQVSSRTHSLRRGRHRGIAYAAMNSTRNPLIEQQFKRWVTLMGNLRHPVYKGAGSKLLPSYSITVDKNPMLGDFTTIQDAVDSIPAVNMVRVVIRINAGVYTEKVIISSQRAFVTIEGAGADRTIVQWGDTAETKRADGKPMGTFDSATFAVNSPYFIAKGITFKNTSPVPPAGVEGKQAVALRITGDTAALYNCGILGAQDTLYDHMGRHYYKDCYIEGSIDFIFGNALSLFEGCHVHAIARDFGAVTAQNRMSFLEDTGFSFVRCKVTGSGALYLGRAWGTFSRVVFAYTYMDNIIIPKGWHNWGDRNREMTVFYGQYKCTGPGANFSGRVAWSRELTDAEAKPFISLSFIDGSDWISI